MYMKSPVGTNEVYPGYQFHVLVKETYGGIDSGPEATTLQEVNPVPLLGITVECLRPEIEVELRTGAHVLHVVTGTVQKLPEGRP